MALDWVLLVSESVIRTVFLSYRKLLTTGIFMKYRMSDRSIIKHDEHKSTVPLCHTSLNYLQAGGQFHP